MPVRSSPSTVPADMTPRPMTSSSYRTWRASSGTRRSHGPAWLCTCGRMLGNPWAAARRRRARRRKSNERPPPYNSPPCNSLSFRSVGFCSVVKVDAVEWDIALENVPDRGVDSIVFDDQQAAVIFSGVGQGTIWGKHFGRRPEGCVPLCLPPVNQCIASLKSGRAVTVTHVVLEYR